MAWPSLPLPLPLAVAAAASAAANCNVVLLCSSGLNLMSSTFSTKLPPGFLPTRPPRAAAAASKATRGMSGTVHELCMKAANLPRLNTPSCMH